jgi:hypothetical protein
MARITGQRRPERGTIGRSGAHRDYRMSTHGAKRPSPSQEMIAFVRFADAVDAPSPRAQLP